MFKELMPVIGRRPVTITISALADDRIRVIVIPLALEEDKKVNESIQHSSREKVAPVPDGAIKSLTKALCVTGTPEEVDAALAQSLESYTECHLELQRAVDNAKEEIRAAVQAIKEREDRERKERVDKSKAKSKSGAPTQGDLDRSENAAKGIEKPEETTPAKEPLPSNLGLF